MNLILIDASEVDAQGNAVLTGDRARHVREVLGVQPGTSIRVGVINSLRGRGMVQEVTDSRVVLRCELNEDPPPVPRVDLLLALPRPKVMRRLWAQLAAIGVGRIILTNAAKVERAYFDSHVLRPEVYRPFLIEGLQQAQDTTVPEVSIRKQLKILVEDELDIIFPYGGRILADPSTPHRVRDLLFNDPNMRLLVAVGPEGGWTDYEKDLLQRHGFKPVSMGPRTLRADTACVSILAMISEAIAVD